MTEILTLLSESDHLVRLINKSRLFRRLPDVLLPYIFFNSDRKVFYILSFDCCSYH